MTGVLVNTGASFVFATVTTKDCWSVRIPSLTLSITECGPTSSFVGVPCSVAVPFPLSTSVSHSGRVRAVKVREVPGSGSVAVTEYVYGESSVADVTGVLVKLGASLTSETVIVKDWTSDNDPSDTLSVTAWTPTSSLLGVPANVAVPSPLSVSESQSGLAVAVIERVSPSGSDVVTE